MSANPLTKKVLAAVIATSIAVPAEGIFRKAYYDPVGILTVCMGHTGPDIDPNKLYSMQECNDLLTEDMRVAIEQVDRCVPGLPVGMLAAFGDAVFNLGPAIVCNKAKSNAARLLAAGRANWEAACRELPRWDKARVAGFMVSLPGLTKRRAREMDVCLRSEATT